MQRIKVLGVLGKKRTHTTAIFRLLFSEHIRKISDAIESQCSYTGDIVLQTIQS